MTPSCMGEVNIHKGLDAIQRELYSFEHRTQENLIRFNKSKYTRYCTSVKTTSATNTRQGMKGWSTVLSKWTWGYW